MSYQEDLSDPQWKTKRLTILNRDNNQCQSCFKKRPEFINLIKGFGIITFDEVIAKGYTNKKYPTGYDDIEFYKDSWLKETKFIGDKNKPFEIHKLKFALKKVGANFGPFIMEGFNLICFYEESLMENERIDLNIHHKFYIQGKRPWEYDDNALITYCCDCHKKTHDNNEIFVYNDHGEKLYKTEICPRCAGSGALKEYDYYQNGVCFQCAGEGVILGAEKSTQV